MQIGLVGLGKMGGNIARRLRAGGFDIAGQDRDPQVVASLADEIGLAPSDSLATLVAGLATPRIVWLMLPAGETTDTTLAQLHELLDAGDTVIDGGNSRYLDALRHGAEFAERGIEFLDVGVSGGVWGLSEGYGLMIGGSEQAVARLAPVFQCLAPVPDRGWVHCGPVGSGHYVKMVHNGIEYGMMQSLAEGLALLEAADEFGLDTAAIAQSWRDGSVIRSWLLDLTAEFLAANPTLDGIAPVVQDSGEGRWTVIDAVERGVPTPAIAAALAARFTSRGAQDAASKMLSAMRHAFGGHAMPNARDD